MKLYFINIGASLTNLYLLLFLWGLSAGIASYVPIVAIVGCILLFVIIPPLLVSNPKIGYIGGLLCVLAILPWTVRFSVSELQESEFGFIKLIFLLPCLLAILSGCLSAYFLIKKKDLKLPVNSTRRLLLSIVPGLLFILYIIAISKKFHYTGK
jgi:hypothetical protein